mmetsp:Transcript_9631/g.26207  ORF Transcript_9631/g.26207 Transcript_9631/m.26207 type:complete len:88 (-) Transcript_9631:169-432(-)
MIQSIVSKVPQQVWVAVGSISLIGACAYPVYSINTRPGHDLFSSEKPEAIREAQEAKRKEYRRLIKERRAQLERDQDELDKFKTDTK